MTRAAASFVLAALALVACNPAAAPKSAEAPAAESAAPIAEPAAPAEQSEPAFVGAWAANAESCALEQDDPDSPMLMTAKGYDQFEAHCDFETVTPAGANEWDVAGRCMTAMTSTAAFKLKVEGDKLTVSGDRGENTYVRCPNE